MFQGVSAFWLIKRTFDKYLQIQHKSMPPYQCMRAESFRLFEKGRIKMNTDKAATLVCNSMLKWPDAGSTNDLAQQ